MRKYIIGIDVGGTNTDVVLMEKQVIIAKAKAQTTVDVTSGIAAAIAQILEQTQINSLDIQFVMLGTTHLLNAALQNRLEKVGIIRLGFPATTALPPCTGWPAALKKNVVAYSFIIPGGNEYNGQAIADLDRNQLQEIALKLKETNIKSVAITGIFAHINPEQEAAAAEILKKFNPDLNITLSHYMGGLGLLERENATILNAALSSIYNMVCEGLTKTLQQLGLKQTRIFLSLNDGTLEPIDEQNVSTYSQQKPVFTLNAGPTNSMRGAAILAKQHGVSNLIVADIGGTSTDVGVILGAMPIEENAFFKIAGVSLNFPTIRTQSIGLGGGSIIDYDANDNIKIGPTSVSNRLLKDSISCGGKILTATDIAVLKKRITLSSLNKSMVAYPSQTLVDKIDVLLHKKLAEVISDVWASTKEKPEHLLLVGGGSQIFDIDILKNLLKDKLPNILIHDSASVANALGAAFGEICGTHIQYFDYQKITRDEAEHIVKTEATKLAIARGANPETVKVKYKDEEEIRYVNGTPTAVRIKVSGEVSDSLILDKPNALIIVDKQISPFKREKSAMPIEQTDNLSVDESILMPSDVSVYADPFNISARAIGSAFLGSGGGGDTRLPELMVIDSLLNKKNIKIIALEELPNEATVVSFGIMGSPSVLEEKLPSKAEIVQSILEMQKKLNKKIDAIVTMEVGGANGLLPFLAAAELNIPIVDADCMGRAFPGINMVTPVIYNKIENYAAILSNSSTTRFIEASGPVEMEESARRVTNEMGGLVFIAYLPMSGKTAKEVCIPGTLSLAKLIGEEFLASKNDKNILEKISKRIKDTDYKKIEEVFYGRIDDLRRTESGGFSVGGIVIKNVDGATAEMVFQNENLLLRKRLPHGFYQELVKVPNLIVVVDYDTLLPISCGQLKYGQKIRVLSLSAPSEMCRPEAMAVVGPEAYQLEKLCQLLTNKKAGGAFFNQYALNKANTESAVNTSSLKI